MNHNFAEEENKVTDLLLAIQGQITKQFLYKPLDDRDDLVTSIEEFISFHSLLYTSCFKFLLGNANSKLMPKQSLLNIMQMLSEKRIVELQEYECSSHEHNKVN